jgi:hypothetical protein
MGSNFRLVRKDHGGGIVTFAVHVAHCDEKGKVVSVTKEPVGVVGYSKEEAAQNLHRMAEAFRAPILEHGAVPEEGARRPLESIDVQDLDAGDLRRAGYDPDELDQAPTGRRTPARKPARAKTRKGRGQRSKS